jgi:dTDP-4-dehydrorhamnose reductase
MATILAFGADGQLGQELAASAAGHRVSIRMVGRAEADIADADAVARAISSSSAALVVNAAAYTKVDRAESEPDAAIRANSVGAGIVAGACAAAGIPLLHVSTDYVFDGGKPGAYIEDDPIAPLGVYGRSKAEGEAAIRRILDHHVILRTSWIYGVYGQNFLKSILRLASERDELRVVADQRGCPTGTADIAEAILSIAPLLERRAPVWGIYHFAGQGATTWHGFASEIVEAQAEITNRRPAVVPIPTAEYLTAARRPANSQLDCSRFAAMFGIKAMAWRARTRQVTTALLAHGWGERA